MDVGPVVQLHGAQAKLYGVHSEVFIATGAIVTSTRSSARTESGGIRSGGIRIGVCYKWSDVGTISDIKVLTLLVPSQKPKHPKSSEVTLDEVLVPVSCSSTLEKAPGP